MVKRILYINPVGTNQNDQMMLQYLNQAKEENTTLTVVSLPRGPHHLDYHYYGALVLPDALQEIQRAEREGFDAAIIGCFYDIGLREARELARTLVVTGPAEASLHIAASLGHSFSILVGRRKNIPLMKENVYRYGFRDHLASFRPLGLGVLEYHLDEEETKRRMIREAKAAVEEDRAEVIILGCTIQFGFYKELQELIGVPVIDSALAAFKHAEFLCELNQRFHWGHSKIGDFEPPPESELLQWNLATQYGGIATKERDETK
jgi:allantoin racemase